MSVEPNERECALQLIDYLLSLGARGDCNEAAMANRTLTGLFDAYRAEIEAAAEQRGYERGRAEVLHHEIDAARCRAVLNRLMVWHKAKSDPSLDQGHSMTSILLDAEKAIYGLDAEKSIYALVAMLAEKERRDAE